MNYSNFFYRFANIFNYMQEYCSVKSLVEQVLMGFKIIDKCFDWKFNIINFNIGGKCDLFIE